MTPTPASNLSDEQIIDEARKHATAHVRDSVLTAFARAVIALDRARATAEPVAWIDEKGEFHRAPRKAIFGIVDDSCGSQDALWYGHTFDEAVEAWKRITADGSRADITGWGCGTLARHPELLDQYGPARGTFACPICGTETPHQHTGSEIQDHREVEKTIRRMRDRRWAEVKSRIDALEAHYPPRSPLYLGATVAPSPAPAKTQSDFKQRLMATGRVLNIDTKGQERPPGAPDSDRAASGAGPEPTGELETALIAECERAIRQRDEFLRTGVSTASHGGSHDTCFGFILRRHHAALAVGIEIPQKQADGS